ncbi:hypothetical protein XELAEV_18034633mg [Xenopus laevis]|uniref:Uncharacterized protein n=1 Tax=Xenopus laevis TaxID=8355 RepID=A0A974CE91_XENLA|nr:hypothetical protein XELAEV_18034633mg [Xenopus laevis]
MWQSGLDITSTLKFFFPPCGWDRKHFGGEIKSACQQTFQPSGWKKLSYLNRLANYTGKFKGTVTHLVLIQTVRESGFEGGMV